MILWSMATIVSHNPHTTRIITNFQGKFFDQVVLESIVSFTAQDLYVRVLLFFNDSSCKWAP